MCAQCIEYVSRKTNNKSKDVVVRISDKALAHQLKVAGINHCLSFEQVADEWIEVIEIPKGNYDNISECRYEVPTVTSIGRVYQTLISELFIYIRTLLSDKKVYSSFISDEISNYNSSVYYSNPDYIRRSYEAGKLLD